ncbi:MAG: NfeD family protein [Ruminococcaceae bacterium]|nr:NfeD family protein [Oscillospiraceae bacterium]
MNWAATVWLILMIGFVVMEAACPFHLVSVWFAIGSLAAMVVAICSGAVWLQITVFAVVSVGLLIAMLPLVKKFVIPKQEKTNVESVVGSMGYVTETVDNMDATGQVKLGGMYWTARSEDGHKIPAGTLVEVTRIEGVKAFVTPVPVEEEAKV